MCFVDLEEAFDSVGMSIEEEDNTRSFGKVSVDSV